MVFEFIVFIEAIRFPAVTPTCFGHLQQIKGTLNLLQKNLGPLGKCEIAFEEKPPY